jgi:CHASE1-domain containing sensor protein
VTVSLLLFVRTREGEQANLQRQFSYRATAGATALQRSVQEHLTVLNGLSILYAATRPLDRQAFREFTTGPLQRYPGMQALGWIPRITEAEREAYLTAVQKEGMGDFQITEWTLQRQLGRAARRDVYYPIVYLEPLDHHRAAVGFNLGSVPGYMAAMQQALSTEGPVASAWLSLAQETVEQFGFLLFVPIYKRGGATRTFEERRTSLQGFLMAMFHLQTLVEQALQDMGLEHMELELSDVTDAASRYLLSLQLSASRVSSWTFLLRQNTRAEAIRAGVHWETTFPVAGRTWSALFHPVAEGWNTPSWRAWGLLVGGVLLTLVCARHVQRTWKS